MAAMVMMAMVVLTLGGNNDGDGGAGGRGHEEAATYHSLRRPLWRLSFGARGISARASLRHDCHDLQHRVGPNG
eukprot:12186614-Alexandrium_andersonii.AAC.1